MRGFGLLDRFSAAVTAAGRARRCVGSRSGSPAPGNQGSPAAPPGNRWSGRL